MKRLFAKIVVTSSQLQSRRAVTTAVFVFGVFMWTKTLATGMRTAAEC